MLKRQAQALRLAVSAPGFHRLEAEVQHYYDHEEGVSAINWEPKASNGDQRHPQFPSGANYYIMMTAIERLKEADKIMTFMPAVYESDETGIGKAGERPVRRCVRLAKPNCSMVLRGAYGNRGHQYEDSAPDPELLLRQAQKAYVEAAKKTPSRTNRDRHGSRLQARFDRTFGGGEDAAEALASDEEY